MRVYVDTDVVISSLLSPRGAAYFLLHHPQIKPVISRLSLTEIYIVAKRVGISRQRVESLATRKLKVLTRRNIQGKAKSGYPRYVTDINDAHIVAGAQAAKVNFLISYNLKHYSLDKIRSELGIVILTPAMFLQYLRAN